MESIRSPEEVRARLKEDVANGKTVVLSTRELDDPSLREQLPQLLEDLSRAHHAPGGGPAIPGYTMLGEIGQGGMSTVYLARQNTLGRHVAIKVAPKWLGGGARARERLIQEARAMARVRHENIVVIHDILDFEDTFAIAMEWVDGRTLASLLRALPAEPTVHDMTILCAALGTDDETAAELDPSPIRHFVRLLHDIALATQAVHDAGLLHLDIKPSNVLIRRDGTPLLADFGVVREISNELTQTRTFAGTPVYAAPEQLRRDDDLIGPRSDVYSLGVTLYEALARSQPLRALDLPGIVQCVESGRMPRLSEKAAVTPDLENIVHKAIAPEPENRYATAAEFADDLLAFLEHRPVKARPLTRPQRLRRWARNEPWQAALAITLTVMLPLLGGLGTYLVLQYPALARLETARNLERANQIKQEVYQRWLVKEVSARDAIAQLEQAVLLDPGATALSCLLAVANEQGWHVIDDVIARHHHALEQHESLRLFTKKVGERRSFYSDEEAGLLRASSAPSASYSLALDRAFRANDSADNDNLAAAQLAIEHALLEHSSDPLLLGLLAWFCTRTEDRDRYEVAVRAIWRRWPDEATALSWTSLAIEPFDRERARQLDERIVAANPRQLRGYEVLCGLLLRAKLYDEVPEVIARARENGIPREALRFYERSVGVRMGDAAECRRFLAELAPDELTTSQQLRALRPLGAGAVNAHIDEVLASEHVTPEAMLSSIHELIDDPERATRVWDRFRATYPDRYSLVSHYAETLFNAGARDEAYRVAALTLPATDTVDFRSSLATRALMHNREWGRLRRFSDYWYEHGTLRQQASYFGAVASIRLSEFARAAEQLTHALHRDPGRKSWYAEALLVDAWLRTCPDLPSELRDVPLAAVRRAQFEERNQQLQKPHDGPWTDYMLAEVDFATGDREAALERIARALQPGRAREGHAPEGYRELIQAAGKRMAEAR